MSNFRIEAKTGQGDRFLILTDDLTRAKTMGQAMLSNPQYIQVSIEHQGQVWIGDAIKFLGKPLP